MCDSKFLLDGKCLLGRSECLSTKSNYSSKTFTKGNCYLLCGDLVFVVMGVVVIGNWENCSIVGTLLPPQLSFVLLMHYSLEITIILLVCPASFLPDLGGTCTQHKIDLPVGCGGMQLGSCTVAM